MINLEVYYSTKKRTVDQSNEALGYNWQLLLRVLGRSRLGRLRNFAIEGNFESGGRIAHVRCAPDGH